MLFGLLVGQPAAFAGSPSFALDGSDANLELALPRAAEARRATIADDKPDLSGSGGDSALLPDTPAYSGVGPRSQSFTPAAQVALDGRKPGAKRARAPPSAD